MSKPFSIPAAILKIMAFITNVKKPSVRIFIGRVKKISIGLIKTFKKPTIAEATIADPNDLIVKPGTMTAVK